MTNVVEITPLTRVEGHGKVTVFLDGSQVERVELSLFESPRLFEALLIGRSFFEIPEIICRICSLCSTVHKLTAIQALESILAVEVDEVTALSRRLILNGGQIQSHALHLYCLVLPDLLGVQSLSELAQAAPEMVRWGLSIKQAGNRIQETVGGRLIHPANIALGRVGQAVSRDRLLLLRDELEQVTQACQDTIRIFNIPRMQPKLPRPTYLALEGEGASQGSTLRSSREHRFAVSQYRAHLPEQLRPHSLSKFALLEGEEPTVGALARLNLRLSGIGDDLPEESRDRLLGQDIFGNNLAQAVELMEAVRDSLRLIDALLDAGTAHYGHGRPAPRGGTGTAAFEAPRGVLIHSFSLDDNGLCTAADVITPTTLNQAAMERDLLFLARGLEGADQCQMVAALEQLVRAYDPCISCAVHVIQRK